MAMEKKPTIQSLFLLLLIITSSAPSVNGFYWKRETNNQKELTPFKTKQLGVAQRIQKRKDITRIAANSALVANTFFLLKGGYAFPTFVSSMVVVKAVAETNEDREDNASLKAGVSLFFSSIAALNGWLHRSVFKEDPAKDDIGKPSLLKAILLMGSRGMELTGGFILVFIQLMLL